MATQRTTTATPPFDPGQYKAGQRASWDVAAAGWSTWWEVFEQAMGPVGERLVELAGIRPGQRLLDVATGIGEPAVTAARKVGPAGRVVATDISPEMLAIGRKRAAELGLGNVEFVEVDAEALDFPDGSFDAVLCRFGLMFLPDVAATLRRIYRLLVPGGQFAAAVWSTPDKVPFASIALGVIARELQPPPPPPGTPSLFGLADSNHLRGLLTQAGFSKVRTGPITVTWDLPSVETFVSFLQDVAAPLKALLANQPAARQAEVWRKIGEAIQPYSRADGTVSTGNEAILVLGRQ